MIVNDLAQSASLNLHLFCDSTGYHQHLTSFALSSAKEHHYRVTFQAMVTRGLSSFRHKDVQIWNKIPEGI